MKYNQKCVELIELVRHYELKAIEKTHELQNIISELNNTPFRVDFIDIEMKYLEATAEDEYETDPNWIKP